MEIDTSNMCSHLKRKLFEEDGQYHKIWLALQADYELTAIVRSRQLHIYRNDKKVLILAGKASPKVLREDRLATLISSQANQGISLDDVIPQNEVCSQELRAFFVKHIGKGFHYKAEFQDWLHDNVGKTFREAVEAYRSIEPPKEIKPQFEYNQYVRDFFADNKGATLKDAIRCWHWKKNQPKSHRYEKSDIERARMFDTLR